MNHLPKKTESHLQIGLRRVASSGWPLSLWMIGTLCLLAFQSAQAQIFEGNLELTSQAEVDAFDYTRVIGDLDIRGSQITNLDSLADLTHIEGTVYINGAFETLHGLRNLTYIGSNLSLSGNPALKNLDGLNNLRYIGGIVRITGNSALTNLDGLSNFTTLATLELSRNGLTNLEGLSNLTLIEGNLIIKNNNALPNLDGLHNLTTIWKSLEITGNQHLTNLEGLSNLSEVGEHMLIYYNSTLTTLKGLDSLTSIGSSLTIKFNPALTNLRGLEKLSIVGIHGIKILFNKTLLSLEGLSGLTSINTIEISSNPALVNLSGLDNLADLQGLYITSNDALTNLDGLDQIDEDGYSIVIDDNDGLIDVNGLNRLTTSGWIELTSNDALTNLNGLSNLSSVRGDLVIQNNSMLSACTCGLGPILDAGGVMRDVILEGNLTGCNSVEEILAATCDTNIATEDTGADLPHHFTLESNYPNPFNPTTTLRFGLPQAQRVRLTVYDALGREVAVLIDRELSAGWHTATFEAGSLASGVYLARLRADDGVETQRMILLK